jgi:FKBP-type peptidyl-prolyl cis-trans isomerase FkpA
VSIRLLACVGVAALALGCSKQEDAAASAAPAAPASAPVAAKNPGAPDGSTPTEADTVRVHYAGRLADGSEFDSSIARGEPATFPLSGVIPCWTQGVAQMKVGGKATLVCPPDLAYGASGVPGVIPPEATLTFDVELLAIESAPQ